MIQRISSRIYSDLTRGSRLFLIAFPFSLAMVALVMWSNSKSSTDVIATSAAVPLIVSYLMIRLIMWMASRIPDMTEEEARRFEREHEMSATAMKVERQRQSDGQDRTTVTITPSGFLIVAFVLGVWCVVAGTISAGIYWCLGLTQAVLMAITIVKWTLTVVAAAAVILCLISFCRESLLRIAKMSHDIFDDPTSMFHGRVS